MINSRTVYADIWKSKLRLLEGAKVVLFGAGRNGRRLLNRLVENGIMPDYFVDNNAAARAAEMLPVKDPGVLLEENTENLKVVITPDSPLYEGIAGQLNEMGLGDCIASFNVRCCIEIAKPVMRLHASGIWFCCAPSSNMNDDRPVLPYSDTAEETVKNYYLWRQQIIEELNGLRETDISEPCMCCSKLGYYDAVDETVSLFNIASLEHFCNARCIYCGWWKRPDSSFEIAKNSSKPSFIVEVLNYLKKQKLIDEKIMFSITSGEISAMPQKDVILDAVSDRRVLYFSNAIVYDSKIAQSMKNKGSTISVDMDSGTRETYKIVKGCDMFERVLENLKRYKDSGNVTMKYNILAGVNDCDEDIEGTVEILKSLELNSIRLSFDYFMPLRSVFYSLARFVEKLSKNQLTYGFNSYYTPAQIETLIQQYYDCEYKSYLERKNNTLREAFTKEYKSDYAAYRNYIYRTEIKELVQRFKEGTRFALIGSATKKDQNVISAFREMGIPLLTTDLPCCEAYDAVRDADIIIVNDKRQYQLIADCLQPENDGSNRLLNIDKYFFSFEPAKDFLEQNITKEFIAH